MHAGRDENLLVARGLNHRGLNVVERTLPCVVDFEDHLAQLATTYHLVLVIVNHARVPYFYMRHVSHALCELLHARGGRQRGGGLLSGVRAGVVGRMEIVNISLAVLRPILAVALVKRYAVIARLTIITIVGLTVALRAIAILRAVTILRAVSTLIVVSVVFLVVASCRTVSLVALILVIVGLVLLVGLIADGTAYHRSGSHAHYGAHIASAWSTAYTSYCGAENGP